MLDSLFENLSFNFFFDLKFWGFFIPIAALYRCSALNLQARRLLLLSCSSLMLLALPRFTAVSLVVMLAIGSFTYVVGGVLIRSARGDARTQSVLVATTAILALVGALALFKYSVIQRVVLGIIQSKLGVVSDHVSIIGISYFTFKMIHFVAESYKKNIHSASFLTFLNYVFFFPSFISGPINRYDHFEKQVGVKATSTLRKDLSVGCVRIIHGLFKKIVLAGAVYKYSLVNMDLLSGPLSWCQLAVGLYAHTLYFYFDFAAYSDIAIGCARIMGIALPENFDKPFLKKNIQQLWASWHMSLTRWLTDYVYWPLSRRLRRLDFLRTRPTVLSNISIFLTFVVCGMWHGDALNFLVWGAYQGTGLAVLNVYQKYKRRIRDPRILSYFRSDISGYVGILLTFHFFVIGILFFSLDLKTIWSLFSSQ